MRVIAGLAKGHKLFAPKSNRVRPALDRVKESIFSILYNVEGKSVLDLFAGCGSVGIEALSRGAIFAVFVEEWEDAIKSIERNLSHCKLQEKGHILKSKVDRAIRFLDKKGKNFDLIFVDPPYLKKLVGPTLRQLSGSKLLTADSRIIVEHHPKEEIGTISGLCLTDRRKYGQTLISFLKKET